MVLFALPVTRIHRTTSYTRAGGALDVGVSPPRQASPEYPVYGGFYNTSSYLLDGVMLSERGMSVSSGNYNNKILAFRIRLVRYRYALIWLSWI